MLRPPQLSRPLATARTVGAVVLLLLGLLVGLLAPPAARADDSDRTKDPLALSIDSLDTATVDGSGPILISGTLTNLDDSTWKDVHVYPFMGSTPVTSAADLAAQTQLPDDALVGTRVIVEGHYATIPEVAAGETVAWSFTIPRSKLRAYTNGPGIYWFGVHALGPTEAGETPTADGRARTFLPLVPKQAKSAQPEKVSVVLPIRRRVIRQPDGRVANAAGWARQLADDGRLGRLLSFASMNSEVSFLLDPAVLDAIRQLAGGNQPRSIAPTKGSGGAPGPSDAPSASSSSGAPGGTETSDTAANADDGGTPDPGSPSRSATGFTDNSGTGDSDDDTKAASAAASHWLERLQSVIPGHEVLALPYADPDLSSLAAHAPKLYASARERGKAVLDALGIEATPTVAPPSGYLDRAALRLLTDHPLTLISDAMTRGADPAVADVDGHRLTLTSAGAAAGGPGPDDPWSPVALRQRIVAEAALRLHRHRPVVVVLPDDWTPSGPSSAFFDGLADAPWLSLSSVESATTGISPTTLPTSRLTYPHSVAAKRLPSGVFDSVRQLIAAGRTLQSILANNDEVAATVLDDALTSTSYAAHRGRGEAADRSWRVIEATLGEISVDTPPGVTLSGSSGRFAVTVANDLDEAVTVHLHARADRGIAITGPDEVQVGPNASSTVTLSARATGNGVHNVWLRVTDATGTQVGARAVLPIRSAQVSAIIWWFVGVGFALLFLAIAVRLARRIQRSRRSRRTRTEAS